MNVLSQAELIAYHQIRNIEETDEKVEELKALAKAVGHRVM